LAVGLQYTYRANKWTSIDTDHFDDWESKLKKNIATQIDVAYRSLPPMLQKMKPNFKEKMHHAHWWRFRRVRILLLPSSLKNTGLIELYQRSLELSSI
jgi:hypothetical protein